MSILCQENSCAEIESSLILPKVNAGLQDAVRRSEDAPVTRTVDRRQKHIGIFYFIESAIYAASEVVIFGNKTRSLGAFKVRFWPRELSSYSTVQHTSKQLP